MWYHSLFFCFDFYFNRVWYPYYQKCVIINLTTNNVKLTITLLPICPLQPWSYKLSVFANRCLVVTWNICSTCKAVRSARRSEMKWNIAEITIQWICEYFHFKIVIWYLQNGFVISFCWHENMVHEVEWIKRIFLGICYESHGMGLLFCMRKKFTP